MRKGAWPPRGPMRRRARCGARRFPHAWLRRVLRLSSPVFNDARAAARGSRFAPQNFLPSTIDSIFEISVENTDIKNEIFFGMNVRSRYLSRDINCRFEADDLVDLNEWTN
ncbi:hypothetical protein [Burkholderia pseudomallei]|uniref:hypothetical protein n=1 Tax=Burkholderia pseudomallei TaxID=28450 RepID=UPI001E61D26B|nr:hypothetical protein [Burkholderia pseudomallei]